MFKLFYKKGLSVLFLNRTVLNIFNTLGFFFDFNMNAMLYKLA